MLPPCINLIVSSDSNDSRVLDTVLEKEYVYHQPLQNVLIFF